MEIIEPKQRVELSAPLLSVNRLQSLAEIETIAAEWRALERRSASGFAWFQTYDWCSNWVKIHGSGSLQPHVLTLREAGVLIAVWPLMIERKGVGVNVLRNLGDPHAQYGGVMTGNDQLTDEQAQALLAALAHTPQVDTAFISLVPSQSALAKAMPRSTLVTKLANESAYLDLSVFKDRASYLEGLGKTQKRNRKRRLKQLGSKGDIDFKVLRPEDDGFSELIRQCLRFKAIWLKQTGRISKGLVMDNHQAFLGSLKSSGKDGPYLFALTVAGEAVAIELGFLWQGHYYAYVGGFDWAWREASPGKVQMEMTVCWLIEQGASAYDLLSNPTGYKESWTNRSVALQSHIVNLTLRGEAYATWWITHARPAVKRIYEWLPADFRVGLGVVRQIEVWYVG